MIFEELIACIQVYINLPNLLWDFWDSKWQMNKWVNYTLNRT